MPNPIPQLSFTRGEIAPAAQARVDLAAYANGLKTCRNFIVKVLGGVVNRPGTTLVCENKFSTKTARLVPFHFNTTQGYCLQLEDGWLRIIKDGGQVLAVRTITATTSATPVVITAVAHGFGNAALVTIAGTGIPYLDGVEWTIANVTADTFELVGSTAPGATSATGTATGIFEIASPYTLAYLDALKFASLADIMTLAHGSVRPKDLSRTDHARWAFTDSKFEHGPFLEINSDRAKTLGVSATTGSITVTAAAPGIFAAANVGQMFYIEEKNAGKPWEPGKAVAVNDVRVSDGRYYLCTNGGTTGTRRPTNEIVGDEEEDGGVVWEYIHSGYGSAIITAFTSATVVTATVLDGIPSQVTSTDTYKWAFGAWGGDQGWPSVVAYFQQRRTFAATPAAPTRLWLSGTNAFPSFSKSTPLKDDDAINDLQFASNEINVIRHMVGLGKLVVFTAGGKWVLPDDDSSPVLTPKQRSARPQGALGVADIRPSLIEDSILYVSDKSQSVMDLNFQFSSNSFAGNDLSVISAHLLEGHQVVDAAYQQVPFRCWWIVRDDGVVIGLTYLKEHQVAGWHRHDSAGGTFERVAVVSEPPEDAVYFQVKRTINGVEKRYTERLASRLITDIKDAIFTDSTITYDGRNTATTTMTLTSSGSTWEFDSGEVFTLTASAGYFVVGNVGSEIHFVAADGSILRMVITGFTSTTVVTVTINRDAVAELRAVALTAWSHAKSAFTGAGHLEGKTVSILADGQVHAQRVVTSGAFTLDYAAAVVHAGLPITADIETLDVNLLGQESVRTKEKIVGKVTLLVESSRGIMAGEDFDHLTEFKQRDDENYDDPVALLTGQAEIRIATTWGKGGHVAIRQTDPLPLAILSIIPDMTLGGSA